MYNYEILNFWNDADDLYVNYIIEDLKNDRKANVIDYFNTSDLDCNYNTASEDTILKSLKKLVEQNKGIEFKIPKVSNLSPLLTYIYDSVCESEANMCHITDEDWLDILEDYDFTDEDIESLKNEIKKYKLDEYITLGSDGYKICGYGFLQCCFNDDREKGSDELER